MNSVGLVTSIPIVEGVLRHYATALGWPSAGFHWRLVELTVAWFPRHPLTPLPMVRL